MPSASALDVYSTIMSDSRLQNFADGAAVSANVLDSHNNYPPDFDCGEIGISVTSYPRPRPRSSRQRRASLAINAP